MASHALETLFSPISMLFYVHRNHQAYQGLGAHNGHIDFHTAPELCWAEMHQLSPLNTKVIRAFYPQSCSYKTILQHLNRTKSESKTFSLTFSCFCYSEISFVWSKHMHDTHSQATRLTLIITQTHEYSRITSSATNLDWVFRLKVKGGGGG